MFKILMHNYCLNIFFNKFQVRFCNKKLEFNKKLRDKFSRKDQQLSLRTGQRAVGGEQDDAERRGVPVQGGRRGAGREGRGEGAPVRPQRRPPLPRRPDHLHQAVRAGHPAEGQHVRHGGGQQERLADGEEAQGAEGAQEGAEEGVGVGGNQHRQHHGHQEEGRQRGLIGCLFC